MAKVIPVLVSLTLLGVTTVEGMRMGSLSSSAQQWSSTALAVSSSSSSFHSPTLVPVRRSDAYADADADGVVGGPNPSRSGRIRGRHQGPAGARRRAGGIVMRARRGQGRAGPSDMFHPGPGMREQRESSSRARDGAALSRKEEHKNTSPLSAIMANNPAVGSQNADSGVEADRHAKSEGFGGARAGEDRLGSHEVLVAVAEAAPKGERASRRQDGHEVSPDQRRGGAAAETAAVGAAMTTKEKKGRRRRRGKKAANPVSRAEAVALLSDMVAKFRAAQVASSRGAESGDIDAVSGDCSEAGKEPATVAAEEFADLAWRCLGSGLPEIALEAHSLYVRAAASGLGPAILLPQDRGQSTRDAVAIGKTEKSRAEVRLLLSAARAHIAMEGVLDGMALLDDAAGLGGAGARKGDRWGGDGDAGAGAVWLNDVDVSHLVEELCVSGGEFGLRAALRLRERLAEEGRVLSREALLRLLEALATATRRDLGIVPETSARPLTFPGFAFTASDPSWFETLRSNARRAWGAGAPGGEILHSPPMAGAPMSSGGGGGGWVPKGARAAAEDREEVDGEGALVPAFDAKTAARMAEELFTEMSGGKEPGKVSSLAQASLVRAKFRSALARAKGPSPPASGSNLADRTPTAFQDIDLELALAAGLAVADRLKLKSSSEKPSAKQERPTKGTTVQGRDATAKVKPLTSRGPAAAKTDEKRVGNSRADERLKPSANAVSLTRKGEGTAVAEKGVPPRPGEEGAFWVASALLQECLACNYTIGAETVLARMAGEKTWARTSTYNSLLWYFRQHRNAKGALDMLQSLRDSETVQPDKQSYTLAIQACVWSGSRMDEAWAVVEEAERAGASFGSKDLLDARLILVQAVGGDVMQALREMAERSVAPDESTLLGVIEACAERGDTEGALDILHMMRGAARDENAALGVCPRPSYRSYVAALSACLRKGSGGGVDARERQEDAYPGGGSRGGGGDRYQTGLRGDWRASKEVLGMMWEDETARAAEERTFVPGTWSPTLQEALRLGPSHVTMPAVPDASCYQLAMECCVAAGRNDQALALLSEMEGRGLSPNEAGLRALIRGFATEGATAGRGAPDDAERRWSGVENALGVFEELAERFNPPSRASFESAIDACVSHPDGLQYAGDLITRMKAVGHDLGSDHYNVLIRGFGDARNLGAALNAFQEMREGVAVGGPGGGHRERTLGWEVDEDMFAALLGACTRSGEAENVSEAIGFLRMNGVNPPSEIMSYLQNEEIESELWDEIFGQKDAKTGKSKEKSRARRYGTHALTLQVVGSKEMGVPDYDDLLPASGNPSRGVTSRVDRKASAARANQIRERKEVPFPESSLESIRALEQSRVAFEEAEKNGGASKSPRHPVGWVGIFTEVFTHAERKEEALKRKAGEARSRERRAKRKEQDRLAAVAAGGTEAVKGITGAAIEGGNRLPRSVDRAKWDRAPAIPPGGRRRRRGPTLASHRRRGRGKDGPTSTKPSKPILVRVGTGAGQGSISEEPSPALDELVAGLRRKGRGGRFRGRQGVGISVVSTFPKRRKKGEPASGTEAENCR